MQLPRRWTSTNNCGTQIRLYSKMQGVPTVKPRFFYVPMARHKF